MSYIAEWVLAIVGSAIIGGVGLMILDRFSQEAPATADAMDYGAGGINAILKWLPTIGLVAAGGIILYIVMRSFGAGAERE